MDLLRIGMDQGILEAPSKLIMLKEVLLFLKDGC